MFIYAILYLCVGAALGYVDTQTPPVWSAIYKVRAFLNIPTADLQEPFYAWYDGKNARSRIDYYGGMTKTFQFEHTPKQVPAYYKISPKTTEEYLNKQLCFMANTLEQLTYKAQPVLPDMANYTYIGLSNLTPNTTLWQLEVVKMGGIVKHTMSVKHEKMPSGDVTPVPVRYEVKTYDISSYDHYFFEYSDYDVTGINQSVFDVKSIGIDCNVHALPLYIYDPMSVYFPLASHSVAQHIDNEFDRFKTKHDKQYASHEEHTTRKSIFHNNLRFIESWNRAGRSFSLAVNHLADYTDDELAVLRGRRKREPSPLGNGLPFPYSENDIKEKSEELPSSFDWRIEGAVTPVGNQLKCGSCWAFGAVGAVEGALFLHNGGHLVRLSQQALVDCSWGFDNNGCNGGLEITSYDWIKEYGLPTYDAYGGYLGQEGFCHIENMTEVTKITGVVGVTAYNQKALMLAIFKHGPISVAIDASRKTFWFYSHGVYYDPNCNSDNLDHAVLAIGYGVLNGQHYWLVKNSWSNTWGDQGYILMASKDNNCGVMSVPTYVTM